MSLPILYTEPVAIFEENKCGVFFAQYFPWSFWWCSTLPRLVVLRFVVCLVLRRVLICLLFVSQLVCWLKICQFSCTYVALHELNTGREIHRARAPLSILRALTMLLLRKKFINTV